MTFRVRPAERLGQFLSLGRTHRRNKAIIAKSGLFDADWYSSKNIDVSGFPGDPLDHYLRHGAAEGRAAGPRFDTRAYLDANPDVATSGLNPLVHYIRYGAKEGRLFSPTFSFRDKPDRSVSFSLLCRRGKASDLEQTFRSIASLASTDVEILLETESAQSKLTENGPRQPQLASRMRTVTPDGRGFLYSAIKMAQNDFVIIVDAGDVLVENALTSFTAVILNTGCDILYSDEQQFSKKTAGPALALKPDWSPDLLTAFNYFGRLTAIRQTIAMRALPESADAAAEWEFNLRASELTGAIEHVPVVLCRRSASAGKDLRIAPHDVANHAAMLTAFWRRQGYDAQVTQAQDGTFRASWPIARRPLVSIIIPNKNRSDLLKCCTDGLLNGTSYDRIEIIVVDNASDEPEIQSLYDELRNRSVKIVRFDEPFNYSRACNLGAAEANGEFLLFLNNDIEIVDPDWLDHLVREACRPGVGVVGAKLLYPDGHIQHAGVALGVFTLAAHIFHRAPSEWGPFGSPETTRNWLAVTGACQLVSRRLFELVNGYDEGFQLSYSDVVFCLNVVRAGFRTIYVPAAVLLHHEGASRGQANPTMDQVLFAKRVRAFGLAQDPYFHPLLDAQSFVPALRKNRSATRMLSPMQIDIDRLAGLAPAMLDIFDDGAVATAAGIPWNRVSWQFDPRWMRPGPASGARILLEFIRRRPDLRIQFPTALRDGPLGPFAHWCKTEGLRLLGLGAEFASSIAAAFAAKFQNDAWKVLLFDKGLRTREPLFLLPSGAKATVQALFAALQDETVTLEGIWWFLVEQAEDVQAAMCQTWMISPDWQKAVPTGGTVFGVLDLASWISEAHGCTDDRVFAQTYPTAMSDAAQVRIAYAAHREWRERYPNALQDEQEAHALLMYLATHAAGLHALPRAWISERIDKHLALDIVKPGVNVLGHFAYSSGLRTSVENLVEGLVQNDLHHSLRDVPVSFGTDEAISRHFLGVEVFDSTIIHVQPEPLFKQVFSIANLLPRPERTYRIGYWYWEFDDIPSSWDSAAMQCDELWTATEFIAHGLRKRYRQPVRVFMPGLEIAPFDRQPRAFFSLDEDEFVFVFVFHMASIMDRKNPLGLIDAFKRAFSPEDRARLVIKTSFGEKHPRALQMLHDAADNARITIVNANYTRAETLSLIAAGDAYVSLHRSEGLGLTMAEAMLLGRPVVATRFSGNLEFMNDENSLLVDHRLVPLNIDIPPYKAGHRWAEPSIPDAARQLRRLYDDRVFARELGLKGKMDLERRFNHQVAGFGPAERLRDIAAGRV